MYCIMYSTLQWGERERERERERDLLSETKKAIYDSIHIYMVLANPAYIP